VPKSTTLYDLSLKGHYALCSKTHAPWCLLLTYRVGQKMAQFVLNTLTLLNINRFSKFFRCRNQEKICNNIITKDPTTPQVCRYTTLWNVKVIISVGMSRMGKTGIVFVEPVAKVNSEWRSTTWHPCKMPALLLDPAAGRRTVTHC